jgi:fatty acid-binding protein DegV
MPSTSAARVTVITDADSCVPRDLAAAAGLLVTPAEAPLLEDYETLPRLRTEVAVQDAAPLLATAGEVTGEACYVPSGDGYGSPADVGQELAARGVTVTPAAGSLMAGGWCALAAARAAGEGATLGEVHDIVAGAIERSGCLVLLEYPELAGVTGGSPMTPRWRAVVRPRGEQLSLVGGYDERPQAIGALLDAVLDACEGREQLRVAVHHASAGAPAEALVRWTQRELSPVELVLAPITRHAATRFGPRMLGIAWTSA